MVVLPSSLPYFRSDIFHRISNLSRITVYILLKFDLIQVLECIEKFKVTDMTLVPPIAVLMVKHPAIDKYDLSSLRSIGCGAAPLSREISAMLEKRLGNGLNMKQAWGMTE